MRLEMSASISEQYIYRKVDLPISIETCLKELGIL